MESKLHRQKNAMVSLAKPKYKISIPEKPNTWGNILSKKTTSSIATISSKKKLKQNSQFPENTTDTINKSIQCDSFNLKPYQGTTSLSVFNPIRTLQFLIKEIVELPNVQNTGISKIVNEMQVVVERIIDEFSEKVSNSKLQMPVINEDSMIPTKENDLNYLKNSQENKYWIVLLRKISELESNYNQLTKNYSKSEEKLQNVIAERNKLLEKFKESCDSIEMLNNREREYLDTIAELKSKLMASEKLISKQEYIITNINDRKINLQNKNQDKKFGNEHILTKEYKKFNTVLKKNNGTQNNYSIDESKINYNLENSEVSKLRSDIKQMKKIVLAELEDNGNKSASMTVLKSECNLMKDFSKYSEDSKNNIKQDINVKYSEYNRQASAIKLAKIELQQLFETVKTQTNISKKLFNSSIIGSEGNLSDLSDDDHEDNQSHFSKCMSLVTDSSY